MKTLFFTIIIVALTVGVCRAEEKKRDDGLFAEGGFFSEVVSSVTDKLDNVASGKEKIVDNNAKGIDKDILEYDANPTGESRGARSNNDYWNYRKKIRQENEKADQAPLPAKTKEEPNK